MTEVQGLGGNGKRFEGETGARLLALERHCIECKGALASMEHRIRRCEQMEYCSRRWDDMEKRIRTLEGFRWQALAITGLMQAVVIALIVHVIRSLP